VRLKEKGYLPTAKEKYVMKSGMVFTKAGKYYVSVLVEIPDTKLPDNFNDGIGYQSVK